MDDSKTPLMASILGGANLSGDQRVSFLLEILVGGRTLVFLVRAGVVDQLFNILLGAKKSSIKLTDDVLISGQQRWVRGWLLAFWY